MNEKGSRNHRNVSATEASHALERLANLVFLTARCAENSDKVRRYMSDAEDCVSTVARFLEIKAETPPEKPEH